MADDETTNADLQTELDRVESEIADMTRNVRELRAGLSDSGPMDPEDRSAVLTQVEELEAVRSSLERRRTTLQEKLGS